MLRERSIDQCSRLAAAAASSASRSELAIVDRLDRPMGRADIKGPRAHQPIVVELLDDVSGPARDPGHGEDRRVEVDVQAHVVIQPGARPIDIGRQVLLGGDCSLDRLGGPFPAVVTRLPCASSMQ